MKGPFYDSYTLELKAAVQGESNARMGREKRKKIKKSYAWAASLFPRDPSLTRGGSGSPPAITHCNTRRLPGGDQPGFRTLVVLSLMAVLNAGVFEEKKAFTLHCHRQLVCGSA